MNRSASAAVLVGLGALCAAEPCDEVFVVYAAQLNNGYSLTGRLVMEAGSDLIRVYRGDQRVDALAYMDVTFFRPDGTTLYSTVMVRDRQVRYDWMWLNLDPAVPEFLGNIDIGEDTHRIGEYYLWGVVGDETMLAAAGPVCRDALARTEPTEFSLTVVEPIGCSPADLAQPCGVLDLSDINAFTGGFLAGDPIADLATPQGVFDLSDVNAFVDGFVGGCDYGF